MAIGGENHQANSWARQALEKLIRDGLPPLPDNFAVYFHYFSGDNTNLKMAMDLLLQQTGGLSQAQCTELHTTHLGLDVERQLLRAANSAIETELTKVMGVIESANNGTQQFGKTLNSFEGKLSSSQSLEQIRDVVTKVTNETRAIAHQNERLQTQLAATNEQLTEMRYNLDTAHKESQLDPLTEVGNRKFFAAEFARSIEEADQARSPLTLLIVDIDHFKLFNDTYGHVVGDHVLRLVARTLVENLKGRDVIARYGGEEFVILLPKTKLQDAEKVANQLRASLGTKQIRRRHTNELLGTVTISIGATEYVTGEDQESFVARADHGLYQAKQTGRNKVVTEAAPLPALASEPLPRS